MSIEQQIQSGSKATLEKTLQMITNDPGAPNFLQAFDALTGCLRFGCGGGGYGLQIDSDFNLHEAGNVRPTRLSNRMLKK